MIKSRKIFEKRSVMVGTAEQMMVFHDAPHAFQKLTPPPIFIQVLRDNHRSLFERKIEFRLWVGPIPLHWLVRHEVGPIPTSFIDRMLDGPLAYWEHQHIFQQVAPDEVTLTDYITLEHKPGLIGLFTRVFFDGLPLRMLFLYRHWVTKRMMKSATR
jgi:ligand-binding SRPBCC domain-containing protein